MKRDSANGEGEGGGVLNAFEGCVWMEDGDEGWEGTERGRGREQRHRRTGRQREAEQNYFIISYIIVDSLPCVRDIDRDFGVVKEVGCQSIIPYTIIACWK